MEMMSLILTILFFVFILFGILWGIIRGLKKTICRGIFLLVTTIILLFVTLPITKTILNFRINVAALTVNDIVISGDVNISEFLTQATIGFVGKNFAHTTTIVDAINALILGTFSSFVYLILFWILKYLLLPINYLISKLIFRKKKTKTETLGFSAFGENPNEDDKAFNFDIPETSQPTALGNIFDPNNQPDEMPIPTNTPPEKKVDNSLFTQEVLDEKNSENNYQNNESTIINIDTPQEDKSTKNKNSKPDKFLHPKENKNRFWGGMVGAIVGAIVMINTMVPFYGFMSIIKSANKLTLNNLSSEPISVSELTNGITEEIETNYSKSILGAVSTALGFETIGLAEYDTITSVKINDKNISTRKDINKLIDVLQSIDNLAGYYKQIAPSGTLNNVSQQQLDELLNKLNVVLSTTKEITFIDCLGDIIIPTISQTLLNTNFELSDNVNINYLFTNTLKSLSTSKNVNIINELTSIIELLKYTNEQKLLLPLLNSNNGDLFKNLSQAENDFTDKLIGKLYKLETINIAMPNLLNIGLTLLSESTDFAFERCELDGKKVKTDLTNIISALIDTANSLNKNGTLKVNLDSLPPIGKLLNSIKNASFLSTNTYNSLIEYIGDTVTEILKTTLPEELYKYADEVMISNFKNVTNWEYDLINLKNAINILRDKENGIIGNPVDNSQLREGTHFNNINLNEDTLVNIGLAFDKLQDTDLFGKTHSFEIDNNEYIGDGVSRLMYYILNIAKDSVNDNQSDTFKDLNNTLETMQNNLLTNYPENPNKNYWENEFKAIAPLIEELNNLSDGGEFELSLTLGQSLDKASTSLLLGGNTTFDLVADMIGNIKSNTTTGVDGKINNLIDNIITKLENPQNFTNKNKFWEVEFSHINSLMDLEFNNNIKDNLSTIGETLDNVVFGISGINSIRPSYLITHSDIRDILSTAIEDNTSSLISSFGDIGTPIQKAIEDITQNIETIEDYSFEFELNKLKILSDIELSTNVFKYTNNSNILNENKNAITKLGETLDSIAFNTKTTNNIISYNEDNNSEIITRNILNTLVKDLLSNINNKSDPTSSDTTLFTSLQNLITSIQSNIEIRNEYVISWKREIGFIHKLTEINSDMTYELDESGHTNRINLAQTLDAIAFNENNDNTKYEDVEYNANKQITYMPTDGNSLFVTRSNLISTIASIINTIKETDPDNNTITKEDIINKLIDNTTEKISLEIPADNTTNGYSNFINSFNALNEIESIITDKLDAISENTDITTIKQNGTIQSLDETLQTFQSKPLCGKALTRMIAIVVLQDIDIPEILMSTTTGTYYNLLISEFTANIDSPATEVYYISPTDDLTSLDNRNFPFRKLLNTIN